MPNFLIFEKYRIHRLFSLGASALLLVLAASYALEPTLSAGASAAQGGDSLPHPPLISDTTAMETAWDIPRSPLTDSTVADTALARKIKLGFRLFVDTPNKSRYASNQLSCNNCHLNGGQRERAMPMIGIAAAFPEFNKRAGRMISLEDRIVECFKRSMDASAARMGKERKEDRETVSLTTTSREVAAISAYINWLSAGYPSGKEIPWRGQNGIPEEKRIPLEKLNAKRGEMLYRDRCVNCHGRNGQGIWIGDKKAGPLWGPKSWNDGAGAARVYTLAGIFLYAMPYINPKSLTEEEAQQIATYIDSKPRPVYPLKNEDYPNSNVPVDAVYYKKALK